MGGGRGNEVMVFCCVSVDEQAHENHPTDDKYCNLHSMEHVKNLTIFFPFITINDFLNFFTHRNAIFGAFDMILAGYLPWEMLRIVPIRVYFGLVSFGFFWGDFEWGKM